MGMLFNLNTYAVKALDIKNNSSYGSDSFLGNGALINVGRNRIQEPKYNENGELKPEERIPVAIVGVSLILICLSRDRNPAPRPKPQVNGGGGGGYGRHGDSCSNGRPTSWSWASLSKPPPPPQPEILSEGCAAQ